MKLKTVLEDFKWVGVDRNGRVNAFHEKPTYFKTFGAFSSEGLSTEVTDFIQALPGSAGKLFLLDGQELIEHIDIPGDGEPVIVFNEDGRSERRYSAGVVDKAGKLGCYSYGLTKWTNEGITFGWKHWRLPTAEEREGLRPSEELK